jgi:uncharacterized C2H2 Zn-finger protein
MNYECPFCGKIHTADQWNRKTAMLHNAGKLPIPAPLPLYHNDDETFFRCPTCEAQVFGHELSRKVDGETDPGTTIIVGRLRR